MNIIKYQDIIHYKSGWTVNGEGFYKEKPEVEVHNAIWSFISYDENGEIEYAQGTVEVLNQTEDKALVQVLTNEPYEEWVGREFEIHKNEFVGDGFFKLYENGEEVEGILVKVEEISKEFYTIGDIEYSVYPDIEPITIRDAFFNTNLKGKYVYAVNMLWSFPFSKLSMQDYIELSNGTVSISAYNEGIDYELYEECEDAIDIKATEKANSIDKYDYLNNYATDSDITIDELKKFRTWLATQLLNTNGFIEEFVKDNAGYDEIMIKAMLEYYKNEMSDAATIFLSMFAPGTTASINTLGVSTCGCVGTPTVNPLLQMQNCGCGNTAAIMGNVSVCDPYSIYVTEIYKYMIKCFSNIDFWDNDYLRDTIDVDFKHYIDNIIKANLPLTASTPTNYHDCTCMNVDDDVQKRYQAMLERLSKSLKYIIDGEISGHKNYIYNALLDWSTYLYEKMRW